MQIFRPYTTAHANEESCLKVLFIFISTASSSGSCSWPRQPTPANLNSHQPAKLNGHPPANLNGHPLANLNGHQPADLNSSINAAVAQPVIITSNLQVRNILSTPMYL